MSTTDAPETGDAETPSYDGVWCAPSVSWPVRSHVGPGLAGAVAGATRIAWHDWDSGDVGYRGWRVGDLRGIEPDALAFLLLTGHTPGSEPDDDASWSLVKDELNAAMELPSEVVEWLAFTEAGVNPLNLLRAGVSMVGCHVERVPAPSESPRMSLLAAARAVGHVGGLVKALGRRRLGHPLTREHENSKTLSERLLSETTTTPPTVQQAALLKDVLLCVADADLDAPAFTGLVVASCLADWHTAICAALAGLEGDVREGRAAGAGRPIPDERRHILAHVLSQVAPVPQSHRHLDLQCDSLAALACEALRRLHIADDLIECVYAFGRMLGVVARIAELRTENRIFRPLARYVGPSPRPVPPLEARG